MWSVLGTHFDAMLRFMAQAFQNPPLCSSTVLFMYICCTVSADVLCGRYSVDFVRSWGNQKGEEDEEVSQPSG
jgi:hypothetical protein